VGRLGPVEAGLAFPVDRIGERQVNHENRRFLLVICGDGSDTAFPRPSATREHAERSSLRLGDEVEFC